VNSDLGNARASENRKNASNLTNVKKTFENHLRF